MLKGSNVRRACAALAAVVLAVAAGACGSGTSDDSGGSSGGGKNTLTLKGITDNQKSWEELIAAYKKENPDVTIKATFAPTDQLQTALRAQLGGGGAPDLFVVWPGNGSAMSVKQLAPSGLLADLSDQELDQVHPGEHPAAARRRRQDLHVVAEHDADRRHLQQAGLQGRRHRRAAEDLLRVPRRRARSSRRPGRSRSRSASRRHGSRS